MIEIVYKEDKSKAKGNEEFFYLPKNIRQIGEIGGARKIYMEDYVYTFLRRMSMDKEAVGHIAILLGRYKWAEGKSYLFIQSAVEIQDMEVTPEHIQFTDKVWGEVHDTMEKYFRGQEILGWVLSLPGFNFDINDVILKTHLNHFAGNDKVLFLMEPAEKEEKFYFYDNGRMTKENGYYIYYEKNEPMQEYMIAIGKNRSIEETEQVSDRAVNNFRKALDKKKETEEKPESQGNHNKVYTLAACVAVAVIAVGFNYARGSGSLPGVLGRFNEDSGGSETAAVSDFPEDDDFEESQGSESISSSLSSSKSKSSSDSDEKSSSSSKEESTASSDESDADTTPDVTTTPEADSAVSPENAQTDGNSSVTSGTAVSTKEYIVQKGDTLSRISIANYGNMSMVAQICELNHLANSELIYEGQKLLLPQS